MRINPISMTYNRQNSRPQNQNNNQNVNFGRFADDEARNIAYDYLKVDEGDSWNRVAFDYLDETPFVTIKSATNKGDTFIYAVAERKAINKHENKELFDEMISDLYVGLKLERAPFAKNAREAGVTSEPGFLTVLHNFSIVHNLYENFCDCEEGNYGKGDTNTSDSHVKHEDEEYYPYKQGYDFYRY